MGHAKEEEKKGETHQEKCLQVFVLYIYIVKYIYIYILFI